jgi:hypothetical protein
MSKDKGDREARMVEALYDDLDAEEREAFEHALASSPKDREEYEALKRLVAEIPDESPGLPRTIWPDVAERLESRRIGFPILPHWAVAAAAFIVVGGGVLYWIAMYSPAAVAPGVEVAAGPQSPGELDDRYGPVLLDAAELAESRRYAEAYTLLAEAVADVKSDPAAAPVVQAMADLAFDQLQWYPEAFAGYDALRRDHVPQFEAVEHNFLRLNMLDEARDADGDYPALHELDAARRRNEFGDYERLVARYPATYVASIAADDMAALVQAREDLADDSKGRVRAMRLAAMQATNPVAKAQLQLEAAHRIRTDLQDTDRAREMYENLANSGITRVAEAAQAELEEWEAGARP